MTGSTTCPICGISEPHGHDVLEVEEARHIEPAFERWIVGYPHMERSEAYAAFHAGWCQSDLHLRDASGSIREEFKRSDNRTRATSPLSRPLSNCDGGDK